MNVGACVRAFLADGTVDRARAHVRQKWPDLTSFERERLGQWLQAHPQPGALHVIVLAECSTQWLAPTWAAHAFAHGLDVVVHTPDYDQLETFVLRHPGNISQADAVVVLPWGRQLGCLGEIPLLNSADVCARWQQLWASLQHAGARRVIHAGYDIMVPGPAVVGARGAPSSGVWLARLNETIRARLPDDMAWLDVSEQSAQVGRAQFYDVRSYHWTKQPWSTVGLSTLAQTLTATLCAMVQGPKKLLVVDLDNTLWGGVVGELGPHRIVLGEGADGEAFVAFQRYLKRLQQRGVLLAVVSKNNEADARAPFEHNPAMVLTHDDFVAFEASWQPKSTVIAGMLTRLGLDAAHTVFFDDAGFEREDVRHHLPQVRVVDVPDDPADYVAALDATQLFTTFALTREDSQRTAQYQAQRVRQTEQARAPNLDAFLAGLDLRGDVREFCEPDMPRIVQLIGKTNQWNVTTMRWSEADIRARWSSAGSICLTLRLRDRLEDYGLVAVLMATLVDDASQPTLDIDTWVMSCRIIGRGAEWFLFEQLLTRARAQGIARVGATYRITKKNGALANVLPLLGFEVTACANDQQHLVLNLTIARIPGHFVKLAAA